MQARTANLKVRVRLVRTRHPGKSIVDEAIQRRADLIYISTEHAPSDERTLGPTTRYVLAKRPCKVIVEGGNRGEPGPGPASWDGDAHTDGEVTRTPPRSE